MQRLRKPAGAEAGIISFPPPLANGDRLSSEEFLRRYEAMPLLKKAELINGIVFVGGPVNHDHGRRDGLTQGWMGSYAAWTPGVEALSNTTLILDAANTLQPDSCLRLLPERGGKTGEDEKQLIVGAPELVVEIAANSASIDLHEKREIYERFGTLEYLVWLVAEKQFLWLTLKGRKYIEQKPDADGLLWSKTFPGLVLAVKPLLALKSAAVVAALQKGLNSPAHAAFLKAVK